MKVPVVVETANGHCVASVVGTLDLRASAPTREEAISRLKAVVQDRVSAGAFVMLEVAEPDMMDLFGKYKDDPSLQDICDEAYRLRDEERKALDDE